MFLHIPGNSVIIFLEMGEDGNGYSISGLL